MDLEDLDALESDLDLTWRCVPLGLNCGEPADIDIAIKINAAAIWRNHREGVPPTSGTGTADGLKELSLTFLAPPYVSAQPLTVMDCTQRGWHLPDMARDQQIEIALRLSVIAPTEAPSLPILALGRVHLQATVQSADRANRSVIVCRLNLGLPLMSASELAEMPGDLEALDVIRALSGVAVRPYRVTSDRRRQ